jgi:FNIP Repeat
VATLSPQKVIVYTVSSIPPAATHAKLILNDPQEFHDTHLTLPSTLTNLILQSHETVAHDQVNQIVTKALPPTLTWLNKFNQPVDKLPLTLTHLTTGDNFNQPVDKLPLILTHLTTGFYFNQPVDKLPPTLTHLTTGRQFNQPVDKLPSTLTSQLDLISNNQLINFHPLFLTLSCSLFLVLSF